ncbi:DNA polymerase/3'-5' exonuclease PolX [Patescibacteria group bacterium]|nr:DNA polymerase/3'-5' exonuclease PolX [Patescibacteria group bacterium]
MKNQEIAKIFYTVATYLQMDGVPFKPYAYEKVAMALEALDEDVEEMYRKGGFEVLKKIPGVGEGIAKAIEECLKTGTIRIYEEYKKKFPMDLESLTSVEGLGPKKVKILYQKLKIKALKDLEKAAKSHKIAPLFGFGEKTEKNILEGLAFLKRGKGRFLLGEIMPRIREILKEIESLKEIKKISLAGSARRMKETIGDVDILTISKNPAKVVDFFIKLPGVEKVWAKGSTKASVRIHPHTKQSCGVGVKQGFDVDLRVVPEKSYGSALQYFTGSKEHNIETRMLAISRGLKLNEYGMFRGSKMLAGKTEEEIYKKIGLPWIPPELRENQGELEAGLKNKLPKLIEQKDIKGDLHCHSNWDGGEDSIEEMAKYARNLGYEYLGISDHTEFLRIEHGLSGRQLLQQRKEIEKLNEKLQVPSSKFQVLQGCETNILSNGSVDIKDGVLSQLDYVIAGVHSHMNMAKEEMTERIIRAMKNPNIDIISHPTGRLIQRREEYAIDFDKILRVAKETGTILEINSSPVRLDLKDTNIRKAKEAGVKMIINTDSHQKEQMSQIEYGVAQARRGWAEKEDVINTQSLDRLLKFFK